MHDFEKTVADQSKDIADIERKIAALSADQSASAIAKRKLLEAELAEKKAALEETYYDRSVEQQQEALDNELDSFKEEKEAASIRPGTQWSLRKIFSSSLLPFIRRPLSFSLGVDVMQLTDKPVNEEE